MKKHLLHKLSGLLLAAAAITVAQPACAQIDEDITGYVNTWFNIKATPQGGGKIFAKAKEGGLKVWRDELSFKQTVPVYEMMGINVAVFILYAQPADGYIFGGWYIDDGDGIFDPDKDQYDGSELEYYLMTAVDDNATVYDTEAAAKSGPAASQLEGTVFAYFTRGAHVGIAYYQDDAPLHANAGTVWVSKSTNEPGDVITIRALPTDGFQFEYWADAEQMGKPVSRENPYTFTVQGGERLYAYFTDQDAPRYEFPEEGGYMAVQTYDTWVISDESRLNGATAIVVEREDLTRADGKIYLDASKEDAHFETTQWRGVPTILYGKGTVRMAFKMQYGIARELESSALVKWSGNNGATVKGDVIYVYAFFPELGAFITIGNTDTMLDPNAPTSVKVPAGMAYFSMGAFDLTDDEGNIPAVIGLSPETYDAGVDGMESALDKLASIGGVAIDERTLSGQRVYTLSGLEVKPTSQKGIFIVNGKKVVFK